jgi:hypothetical protein
MRVVWLAGLVAFLAGARADAQVTIDVTVCGIEVPSGVTGVLRADLHCPDGQRAVALGIGTTLDLNGHTLSGAGVEASYGVVCTGRGAGCRIVGPGAIVGFDYCLYRAGGSTFFMSDLEIHDCGIGIFGYETRLHATNLTVTDNHERGIEVDRVTAVDVVTSRNGDMGMLALKVVATRLTASDNGAYGVRASQQLRGTDITLSGNATSGVFGDRVVATRVVAIGNGDAGVFARKAVLRDSDVSGNDGFQGGIDLVTSERPRLFDTTCGRSLASSGSPFGPSWGVCAQD